MNLHIDSFIIGTAGHIDHGKTALVKALTGIDTDRLKEEKRRGISIELGYAPLKLSETCVAGIVDVPGHDQLIKTMVMGATQIDLALFVVAANEGMMPQSREHLSILSLLGVKFGIVVLTKTDVTPDSFLALENIQKELRGTFLEKAPIVQTSCVTREGIGELRNHVQRLSIDILKQIRESQREKHLLRIPIDRVFTLPGVGTTVTGPLLYGDVSQDDECEIYPQQKRVRVRQIQAYGNPVSYVRAPSRVALNIKGVSLDDVRRGEVLGKPGTLKATDRFYANIHFVNPVEGTEFMLHHGTARTLARLKKVDQNQLYYVKLSKPIVLMSGDRFILRRETTLAGGEILDASPVKKHIWIRKDRNQPKTFLMAFLKENPHQEQTLLALQFKTSFSQEKLRKLIEELPVVEVKEETFLLKEMYDQRTKKKNEQGGGNEDSQKVLVSLLREHAVGWEPADMKSVKDKSGLSSRDFEEMLRSLVQSKKVVRLPKGFYLTLEQFEKVRCQIKTFFEMHSEMSVVDIKNLFSITRKHAIPYLEFFDNHKWTFRKGDIRKPWNL